MESEAGPDQPDEGSSRRRLPLRRSRIQSHEEGLAERLAQQWSLARADRHTDPLPIQSGPSNFSRAQVPFGVDLAAAWAWRFLVIAAAGYLVFRVIGFLAVIALPIAVSLLIAALVAPLVRLLSRGLPPKLAAALVVIGGLLSVALLLTFVGQQVATGASDLADSVVQGIGRIRDWLENGPLQVSDSQLDGYLSEVQRTISESTREGGVFTRIGEVGTAVGHVVAGFFIVLFATFFFIADGDRIWAWTVRIAPRAAREKVDSSGRVAWRSLTQFVRATVLVAAVDAIGIMIVAAVLGVPFVLAIGVLVFLGAFVPMIGATIAGTVAVLVALVDQGPLTALLMLGGVIAVQQIEGHVLQPFLMGRFVSVHPLGVIVAIGCGVLVAGIAGALIAVPLASAVNAVVQHLAADTDVGEDPIAEDDHSPGEPPDDGDEEEDPGD
ncbi:AI-2E family transporter [Nocardioides sp. GXQ0305]|uniref:AI-2E family transporter n=1 Tax=Nocardioides sp. GXQ0305 TaxID=3423912 RepID=UPI003D7DA184